MLKIETGTDNEILRKVSEPVNKNDFQKIKKLGEEMVKYIKNPDNGGVGLAAPQVGVNKRLIAVSLIEDSEDENFPTIMMINPEIVGHGEETEVLEEGCLSVPGKKGKVKRYTNIKVTYLDDKQKKKILLLSGLPAQIVQHEYDHLEGILFTDKLEK